MEIKITADKKLLDVLDKIAAAVATATGAVNNPYTRGMIEAAKEKEEREARQEAKSAPQTAAPAKVEETPAPSAEPAVEANSPTESEPVPSRDEIQRLAIVAIQGGHREEVKSLIEKFGGTRVKDVPEKNLAAFKAGLEAL